MNIKLNLTTEECNDVIDAIKAKAEELGYDEDETLEDMIQIVDSALEAMGIECIWDDDADEDLDWEEYEDEGYDDEEEEEEEDFDWDKEYDDEKVYKITPKGKFVALLLESGVDYENALFLANEFYDKDGQLKTKYQDKPKVEEKTEMNITIYNENGHRVISKADADRLMEIIQRVVNCDKRIPLNEKDAAAKAAFLKYCEQELKVEGVMRE